MSSDPDNGYSLKEYIEDHKRAHAREHDRDWHSHSESHTRERDALEIRLREHAASHEREHIQRDIRDKENDDKLNIRLAGMNEIRAQLNEQAQTFVRSEAADAKFSAMTDRLANLERWRAQVEGRGGGASQTVIWIFAGLSALATVVGLMALFNGGG